MTEGLLRKCLLQPPSVFETAALQLEIAANAVLDGRQAEASAALILADIQEIMAHTIRVVGPLSMDAHRNLTLPKVLPKDLRARGRMPSAKEQDAIFERDKWRCRFCGAKVICKKARSVFVKMFPLEAHWGGKEYAQHTALYALESSIDHVLPHSRGGTNDPENLVTSCYCCQRGRGQWTIEEVELLDPRLAEPPQFGWDGLTRLRKLRSNI